MKLIYTKKIQISSQISSPTNIVLPLPNDNPTPAKEEARL